MSNSAVNESAGEWYLGVYCRKCHAPVPVFRDRGRGAAITEGTGKLTVVCPGCGKNAHYNASEVISFLVHGGPTAAKERGRAPVNDDRPTIAEPPPAAPPSPAATPPGASPPPPAPEPEPQPVLELEPDPALDEDSESVLELEPDPTLDEVVFADDEEAEPDDENEPVLELAPEPALDAEPVLELDPEAMLDDEDEADVEHELDAALEEEAEPLLEIEPEPTVEEKAEPALADAPEPTRPAESEPAVDVPPGPVLEEPLVEDPALEGPVLHGEVEPVLELEPDPALESDLEPIDISGLILDLTATEAEPAAAEAVEPRGDMAFGEAAMDEETVGESPVAEAPLPAADAAEPAIAEAPAPHISVVETPPPEWPVGDTVRAGAAAPTVGDGLELVEPISEAPAAEAPISELSPAATLDTGTPGPDASVAEAFAREALVIETRGGEPPVSDAPVGETTAPEAEPPGEAERKSAVETDDALLDLIAAFETAAEPPRAPDAAAAAPVEDVVAAPPAAEIPAGEPAPEPPVEAERKSAVETDALLELMAAFETTEAPPALAQDAAASPAIEHTVPEPAHTEPPAAEIPAREPAPGPVVEAERKSGVETDALLDLIAAFETAEEPPRAVEAAAPAAPVVPVSEPAASAPQPEPPAAEPAIAAAPAPAPVVPVRRPAAQAPAAPKPIARVYRERWAEPANRPQVIVELRPVLHALKTRADATGHDVLMRVAEQFLDYLADVPVERQNAAAVEQYINAVFALATRGPVRGTDPVGEAMAASLRAINRHAGLYRAA